MTIGTIILTILTTVFGGTSLIQFFTIKELKREKKANVEEAETKAQSSKVVLVEGTVNTMISTVESLMNQNKGLIDSLSEKTAECERLKDEKKAIAEKLDALDKKVTRMINANKNVIKALEELKVDPKIINQLKEVQNDVSCTKH